MRPRLLMGLASAVMVDCRWLSADYGAGLFRMPTGLAPRADGGVWLADTQAGCVYALGRDGTLARLADPITGQTACFRQPEGVAVDADGAVYVADSGQHVIWRVTGAERPWVIAGQPGQPGYGGDGGPGHLAHLNVPAHLFVTGDGRLLVAERGNHVVRQIRLANGAISTFMGTGRPGFNGDGGHPSRTQMHTPASITVGQDGSLLLLDSGNHRLRRIGWDGRVRTLAGRGVAGNDGDDGPATAAALRWPQGVATLPDGAILIADTANHRLRIVTPDGRITAVVIADPAAPGFRQPWSLAVTPDGQVVVSESIGPRVRRLAPAFN